ncbi:unnamed protein product, partial [marine sediment metagenome]
MRGNGMVTEGDFIPLWLLVAVGTVIFFGVLKYCRAPKDDGLSANQFIVG